MGCLLPKTSSSQKYKSPKRDEDVEQQSEGKNAEMPLQSIQKTFPDVPLMQDDISDLLTDSSLDDQEIQQIDQLIGLRKIQLIKIQVPEKIKRWKSCPDINTIFEEKNPQQRNFSQGQIVINNISINNLYYEKFLSQYKADKQPSQEEQILIPLKIKIEQIELKIEEEIFSQENSFSSMKQLVAQCKWCTNEISEDQYQLECFHFYHTQCLQELIIKQIERDQTLINCICHQSIKTKLIKQILLNDEKNYENLLKNQDKVLNSTLQ